MVQLVDQAAEVLVDHPQEEQEQMEQLI